jgi:hypothetical protein
LPAVELATLQPGGVESGAHGGLEAFTGIGGDFKFFVEFIGRDPAAFVDGAAGSELTPD